jgi:hypothetical protein
VDSIGGELLAYGRALTDEWFALVTSGAPAAFITVYEHIRGSSVTAKPYAWAVFAFGFFVASFRAWRKEHAKAVNLSAPNILLAWTAKRPEHLRESAAFSQILDIHNASGFPALNIAVHDRDLPDGVTVELTPHEIAWLAPYAHVEWRAVTSMLFDARWPKHALSRAALRFSPAIGVDGSRKTLNCPIA